MSDAYSDTVSTAREYYNDDSADRFYFSIWGGEDIHIGLYEKSDEDIPTASRRTVEKMAAAVPDWSKDRRVIDLGAGYGGSARHLARHFGCHVTCLNLSEVQNQRNRKRNQEVGLQSLINVLDGSFEAVPSPDGSFDVVWSQDAFLHSGNRALVCREAHRVLKPGGYFVFTDPMQADDTPRDALKPVLDRLHLDSMGSPGFYREQAAALGWKEIQWFDQSPQLVNHYRRVREELVRNEAAVLQECRPEYLERMKSGLQNWVNAGNQGYLKWGIFLFRKET
jgi:sarcosine/dimethylglycine N-methyltransferase